VSHRTSRRLVRAAVVGLVTTAVLGSTALAAAPAFADKETGLEPGEGLGLGLALLIFIGIPLGVFVLFALLTYGPSMLRRPRYRPGYQEWGYRPLWIGGPIEPDVALTKTVPDDVIDVAGGGAGAGW
jgi:hypothetical protein